MILAANQTAGLDAADRKYRIYRDFDILHSSHQVKLLKPTREYFRLMCRRARVKPAEVLLIDDTQRIIDEARKLVLNAVLFKDTRQLRAELAQLGLKV